MLIFIRLKKLQHIIKNESGDGFIVLMTALSVILLAFFVLLNSLASVDKDKMDKSIKSIQGTFGGGFGPMPSTWGSPIGKNTKSTTEFDILAIPELEMHVLSRDVEKSAVEKGLSKDISVFSSDKKTVISFSEKAGFRSGSSELEKSMFSILDKIAEIIKRTGRPVHIKGHTDNVPLFSAKYASNWELSTARAVNTLKYIVEKGGIDPSNIAAVGLGDSRPFFANNTSLNRSRNRRVEIELLEKNDEL